MLTVFILAGLFAIYYGNKNKPIASNLTIPPQGPGLPDAVVNSEGGVDQGPLLGLAPIQENSTIPEQGPQLQYTGQNAPYSLGKQNEADPYVFGHGNPADLLPLNSPIDDGKV